MKLLYPLIVLLFLWGIPGAVLAQEAPLRVVATTTLIADVARQVGGDLVEVTSIIPPDSDVHAFRPAPQDAVVISRAKVILVNGANLEEGLLTLVEGAASVPLTVVSNGVPMLAFGDHAAEAEDDREHRAAIYAGILGVDTDCGDRQAHDDEAHPEDEPAADEHGACDPHVWQNPQNVMVWADNIAEAFAAADPVNAATYRANAAAYKDQLAVLDAELEALFNAIPQDRRVIVTNHEFLGYLAARYELEVIDTVIPSLSTLAEPAPQDMARLIEVIQNRGVRAVFVEASDPGRLAAVIAEEAGEVAVVTLFSGSLSAPDGPAGTYLDYMRANAQAITAALGG
ncbi:MAG TPA: zinc ABC transporter substrate-binding protein [Spirillospora sp.]|nr:zinc ABC transporter substrate-binding protein [Spirillospora sp.]